MALIGSGMATRTQSLKSTIQGGTTTTRLSVSWRKVDTPPIGADNMRVFAPYLSKALLHRIDLAMACDDDWARQKSRPEREATRT